MQVTEGSFGRVLVVRLEHGEDILDCVTRAARERGVEQAVVWLLGATAEGELVVGPRKTELPPESWLMGFDEGRELVALGTIFPGDGEPVLHLHAVAGRGESTLAGCLQPGSKTFLVIEAIIAELVGVNAQRTPDPSGRFRLLDLGGR